jgi:hypothetical protein
MATTANVFSGLGVERFTYRQVADKLGILTTARAQPKCIAPGLIGYNLGLHNRSFATQQARNSGATTYYVRVVPIYGNMSDPNGLPLMGTPTTINTTAGVTFDFDPMPIAYPCTGYYVYAGTTTTTLYYQGELTNRYATHFVVGTTWTYVTSTSTLTAQASGPANFANVVEVYQVQGGTDSRVFLGGGKPYSVGYARVANAAAAPVLTGGTAGSADFNVWALVAAGSFRMRMAWNETVGGLAQDYDSFFDFTALDFTTVTSMADVATAIQTAIRAAKSPTLYTGTGSTPGITTWQAVTAGSFDIYINGVLNHVTGCNFAAATSKTDVASIVQAAMVAMGGDLALATCTWDSVIERFVFKANIATPTAGHTLSYLSRHSTGTGTDIAAMLDGLETSSTAVLNGKGKAATTHTVTFSTDHFIVTGPSTGGQYRLSFLAAATADRGTDISTATYMDCLSTSQMATYVSGATAYRTVYGQGTNWGTWAEGDNFRIKTENKLFIVTEVYETDCLLLDSNYDGSGFFSYVEYFLLPFSRQLYVSALGNPFYYNTADIVPLPTADGDAVTAIRRVGSNIVIFMKHHFWLIDGVDIGTPIMKSNVYGVPNNDSCIEYGDGIAFFTGKDFRFLSGGQTQPLDPEGRMKDIISRISPYTTEFHGVYEQQDGVDQLKWWLGLDSSRKHNVAVVHEPRTGAWYLYYHKDANCSAIVRDSETNKEYLLTGSQYDDGHAVPAFTFIHGPTYYSDGSTQDAAKTVQGLISVVGAATTTAGYLTCGKFGNTLANLKLVTTGYFRVTIDDDEYSVGPINFSGAADLDACAALIQVAIRVQTGGTETCVYSTDRFKITSSTTTNRSNVDYLRPYYPDSTTTDISGRNYLNGRENFATKTFAVNQRVLTLTDMGSVAAVMDILHDGEKGVYLYVCDSNYRNGQYALVTANTATTVTVTPDFANTPAAGWYWFMGGIVPTYTKWFDYGSPQHKNKLHGVAISVKPETGSNGNTLVLHGMQDLSTTIRTTKTAAIGGSADTTQVLRLQDKEATQTGLKIMRPSSRWPLKIEDITLVHAPRV